MMDDLSEELRFAIAASCDTGPDLPGSNFDWVKLHRLAVRHRIEGVVGAAVSALPAEYVPAETRAQVDVDRRSLALMYLGQLAETLRISKFLERAGIPCIALKGCIFAKSHYDPHPEQRHAVDIDILVAPSDFAEADRCLKKEGYVRSCPNFEPPASSEEMVHFLLNAYEYRHSTNGLHVELHHRLLFNPYILPVPFHELLTNSEEIKIADGRVRGLTGNLLAAYLCAHSAGHAFFRLKWVADTHRLFSAMAVAECRDLLVRASNWRCKKPIYLALFLEETLTGSVQVLLDDERRRILKPLLKHCLRELFKVETNEVHGLRDLPDDFRRMVYGMRLTDDVRARAFPVLRSLIHPDDARLLKLDTKWMVLYALMGRPLAASRLVKRTLRPNGDNLIG